MQVRNIQSYVYSPKKHIVALNKNNNSVNAPLKYSANKKNSIAFKGSNFSRESIGYRYENNDERIAYRTDDGSFAYATRNSDGSEELIQYNLEKQEEIRIAKDSGYFYMQRTNPFEQEITKKELKTGEVVYHQYKNISGDFTEEIHDKKLKRFIHKQKVDDIIAVTVQNEQGEYVTSGRLTWDEGTKDESTRMIVTRNMVTKKVVKRESYDIDNTYMSLHDEETGQIIHEEYVDRSSGYSIEKDYYRNMQPSRILKTNPTKTRGEEIKYNEEGNETEHTVLINRPDLIGKQIIIPNTNIIQSAKYEYKDKKTDEIKVREDLYRQNPNTVYKTVTTSKFTGKTLEEAELYEDGKTPKVIIEYLDNGEMRKTSFNENYQKTIFSVYTSKGFEIHRTEYNVENGGFKKVIDQDPITKQKKEYLYDKTGRKTSEHRFYNRNGDLYESAIYYPFPNKPQILYEYSKDYCKIYHFKRFTNGLSEPVKVVPIENKSNEQPDSKFDDSDFIGNFHIFDFY